MISLRPLVYPPLAPPSALPSVPVMMSTQPFDAAVFGTAATVFPDETDCMGIVHHDQRIISVREIADPFQIRNVAVHGKYAVCGDEFETCAVGGFQLFLQVRHIVILIAETLCLAETDAVDDAGMVQGIADDGVFGSEQSFEESAVRIETGTVEDRILRAEKCGDLLFQLLVNVLCAADESDGGKPVSAFLRAFLRRLDDFGMDPRARGSCWRTCSRPAFRL